MFSTSDDNVTGTNGDSGFDEVLSLSFDVENQENVDINGLYFRNTDHGTDYAANSQIDVKINGGTWTTYTLGVDDFTAVALGQVLVDFTQELDVTNLMLRYVNAQFCATKFD